MTTTGISVTPVGTSLPGSTVTEPSGLTVAQSGAPSPLAKVVPAGTDSVAGVDGSSKSSGAVVAFSPALTGVVAGGVGSTAAAVG